MRDWFFPGVFPAFKTCSYWSKCPVESCLWYDHFRHKGTQILFAHIHSHTHRWCCSSLLRSRSLVLSFLSLEKKCRLPWEFIIGFVRGSIDRQEQGVRMGCQYLWIHLWIHQYLCFLLLFSFLLQWLSETPYFSRKRNGHPIHWHTLVYQLGFSN